MAIRNIKLRYFIAIYILAMPLLGSAQTEEGLLINTQQSPNASMLNKLDETLLNYWLQLDDATVEALLDDDMPLLLPNTPTLTRSESAD